MHRDRSLRPSHFVLRAAVFVLVLFSLLAGGNGSQTARAAATGSISGTVKDAASGLPITDFSIAVAAQNNSGATLQSTCSDPATGQYTLTGLPLGSAVKVLADGSGFAFAADSCQASRYGYEYWQHALTPGAATSITLTSLHPSRTGISFTLGGAVPAIEYLVFNLDHANIDELDVRQAIAHGVDRQNIIDTVRGPTGEYGIVPDSYVAPNAWGAATTSTSPAVTAYAYDPTLARTILDNAGWVVPLGSPDGIRYKDGVTRLSLTYKTTTAQVRQDTGAVLYQELHDIGIEIIPSYIDAGTFFGSSGPLATGSFDIAEYTTGYCGTDQDKTCVPFPMFVTEDAANYSRYSNQNADDEYNLALASADETERLLHDRMHQQIVMDDLPVLPLATRNYGSIAGVIKKLDGTPLTGLSIEVDAQDSTSGDQVATACTNPANGAYSLTGIPADTSVAVYATGGSGCGSNSSFYGWSYYSLTGDVTNLNEASPMALTGATPAIGGVDLSLGEAVPPIEYLIFNLNNSNLDQSVRQAIAYGTDRLHILDAARLPNGEYGTVENSYVADNHWAKAPDASLHLYPYDPAQAETLLTNDGWVPGLDGIRTKNSNRLSLQFKTTWAQVRQDTGAIFVQEMQAIGIEVIPSYIDPGIFFGAGGTVETRDFDIAMYTTNYCRDTLDKTCMPFTMYNTGDPGNTAGYSSGAADAEYAAYQSSTTDPDRLTHAINHQAIVMEDLPYLPLFTRTVPLTISGNAGAGGAKISWTDGTLKQKSASSSGSYSITVPFDWTGSITPSKSGRVFVPASRSYSKLKVSKTGQNFKANYIASYASTGAQDGWILESGEFTNAGGSMNAAATTFVLGDNVKNRQYRAILSFNTSKLPDTAQILSAVVKIEQSGPPSGTDPFTVLKGLKVDIRTPYFGTLGSLQLTDFNAPPNALAVGTFNPTPVSGWYSAALSSTGRTYVSKTGTTQLRLYFLLDDNNNQIADNMPFFSGNALTADRPVLSIIYKLP